MIVGVGCGSCMVLCMFSLSVGFPYSAHNMFALGLNKCGFDVWLEVVFGLVCQSCGSHMLVGFPRANFVVVGLGGAEPLVWLRVSLCDCTL